MKKLWMFVLLAPLLPLSAGFPIYEEEYETRGNYQEESAVAESYVDEFNSDEAIAEESWAYEAEAQEEEVFVPPRKSAKVQNSTRNSLNSQRQQSTEKRAPQANRRPSVTREATSRSKMRDARENSNRPRVTQRGRSPNIQQMEADAQAEEQPYSTPHEQPRRTYRSKEAHSQPAERKTEETQRHSSFNERRPKGKAYRQAYRKGANRVKAHSGKRPVHE